MSRRRHVGIAACALAGLLSGCAPVLIGAGAVGGYAISNASMKNQIDRPFSQVYLTSREVTSGLGFVTEENEHRGTVKLLIEGVRVTVTVKPISHKTVELKVKARNNFLMPQPDVAQRVYNAILERLL